MKKIITLLLIVAVLFSGCVGDKKEDNSDKKQTNESVDKGEKSNLTFWFPPFASGDVLDKEFWDKTLAPWADENNVNLAIEITPWGGYEEKYLTGFSSETGPDVGYMYNEMINDFIDMGVLEDIDKYFTEEEKENYIYYKNGYVKGGQYAMPVVVGNPRLLFYNKDIFEEAGIEEPPATWEELIDVSLKIKDAKIDGVIPFAQEWADPAIGALNNIYYPYLWQAGGEIYNPEGTRVALKDNDAGIRAATFLHDLKFKYGIIDDASMSFTGEEVKSQFMQGKIAMASMSANASKELDEAGINWDIVPSLKDKTKAIWIASDALIINSKSKNKDLAVSLVKHITSAEVMTKFHKEVTMFPPLTKDEPYNDDPRLQEVFENESEYFRVMPIADSSFKVMDTLYKNLQLMMLGDLTPEQAIDNTIEYSEDIID